MHKNRATKLMSEKQKKFLNSKHARINILSGAVRSGKTYISLYQFALFILSKPTNAEFIMVGRTLTNLKRNCLGIMEEITAGAFKYSLTAKQASLFGRTIWLEGANDIRSEGKIRGMTLMGAYIDELTLIPHDFFVMLLARLSLPKARLYATTNPDNQMHWVKAEYIDNPKIDCKTINFMIDDNPFLDKKYIENLKKEYAGTFYYNRYILGEWRSADGVIYDMFDYNIHVYKDGECNPAGKRYIGVDYGTSNPMVFLDIIDNGKIIYVTNEYYYDSKKAIYKESKKTIGQKTDSQYANDFDDFIGKNFPMFVVIDPSATSFKVELRNRGYRVKDADNEVLDGIRMVASMLNLQLIKIHESCKNLLHEIENYSWDKKAIERGEEKPIKQNDHTLDALRYFVKTIISGRRLTR